MAKNHDFSDVVARYGATRFFTEKRAVSVFLECQCLTSCQKSKKSLERLLRICWRTDGTGFWAVGSTEVENWNGLDGLDSTSDFWTSLKNNLTKVTLLQISSKNFFLILMNLETKNEFGDVQKILEKFFLELKLSGKVKSVVRSLNLEFQGHWNILS